LNEFTNFDEPFGGMATLLRVDPSGGCTAYPTSTTIISGGGTVNSGTYKNLGLDDALYYRVNSTTTGTARSTNWYGQFTGVPVGAANLKVTYKGRNCPTGTGACSTTPKPTSVFIWNWAAPAGWVQIAGPTGVAGPTDTTFGPIDVSTVPPPPGARFVGTGANRGRVRVRVFTQGTTTNFVTGGNLMKLVYDAP
jgi:hypothetical protein